MSIGLTIVRSNEIITLTQANATLCAISVDIVSSDKFMHKMLLTSACQNCKYTTTYLANDILYVCWI